MNCVLLESDAFFDGKKRALLSDPTGVRHLKNVLGAQAGDGLKIGEYGGNLGRAVVAGIDEKGVWLEQVQLDTPPPPKLGISVVLALPRPKVYRRLMVDMAAMGVDRVVVVNCARSEKSYWQSPLLAKTDAFLREGLQQGVDTRPPVVRFERRFRPFVEDRLADLGSRVLVAHPYGDRHVAECARPDVVAIGAEGGFVEYEIQLLRKQGAAVAHMGRRVLRTEAALSAALGRYL